MSRREELFEAVRQEQIVTVVREDSAETGLKIARTLVEHGARIIEVTMTTPDALDIIQALKKAYAGRGLLLAAGSLRGGNDAAEARRAGAEILVSPHTDLRVIDYALEHDLLCIAGALTPTEVVQAWEAGAGIIKIFPAPQVGGPAYITALRQPIRDIPLLAGGPIPLESIDDYLDAGAIAVNLGATLALPDLVRRSDWSAIGRRLSIALATIQTRTRTERPDAVIH